MRPDESERNLRAAADAIASLGIARRPPTPPSLSGARAMDTMYQRGKIQEESLHYERRKHDGTLPLIGVNTFLPKDGGGEPTGDLELMRSTEAEKGDQIAAVRAFQELGADRSPALLERLREVARDRENVFAALMEAVKVASLGQISGALYDVGGEYRRNM